MSESEVGNQSSFGSAPSSRRRVAWLALALVFVLHTQPCQGKEERLSKDSRIELIRGLSSEIAVAKIAMPRGKHGIYVSDKGKVNQTEADSEIRANGAAIRAGMPVEITKITFKSDRIVFDINGGGKSSKKWYQHIQIGIGGATQPLPAPRQPGQSPDQQPEQQGQSPDQQSGQSPPVLTYGSYISLTFPGKVPSLTTQQAKQMLASVLDFERHAPTALYSPAVPPQFKDAIKKHEVLVGMDRDCVLSSKGPPDRKVREVREGVEKEDWIYGLPPHSLFVTFDGDVVASVHQY